MFSTGRSGAFSWSAPGIRHGFFRINSSIKGEPTAIYDLMGKDVPLFHYAVSDDEASHGTQFVESSRVWFDSVWSTIAYLYEA